MSRTVPASPLAVARVRRARALGFKLVFMPAGTLDDDSGAPILADATRLKDGRCEVVRLFADGTAKRMFNLPVVPVEYVGPEYDGCSEAAIERRNHDRTVATWSREEYDDAIGSNDPCLL
jgi:hypothetical protein